MTATPTEFDERFERAFDSLFRAAMRPATRILRSTAEAEDVAAEVLARVYVDWRRLADQPWVEAWTVRVSTNLAIDRVRCQARRPLPVVEVTKAGEWEVRMDLVSVVARLPRRQRQAVSLRYFGDLPEADVAAVMDVSVGSVKRHVHRGLEKIRAELGEGWALGW
jgi:RNA polymerase sigma factor (sigma-70 family)